MSEITLSVLEALQGIFVVVNPFWLPLMGGGFVLTAIFKMILDGAVKKQNLFVTEVEKLAGAQSSGGRDFAGLARDVTAAAHAKIYGSPKASKKTPKLSPFQARLQNFHPVSGNFAASRSFLRSEWSDHRAGMFSMKASALLLGTAPATFVVLGVFATFGNIMQALSEISGAMGTAGGPLQMGTSFTNQVAYSVGFAAIGFLLGLVMFFWNALKSPEGSFMELAERFSWAIEGIGQVASRHSVRPAPEWESAGEAAESAEAESELPAVSEASATESGSDEQAGSTWEVPSVPTAAKAVEAPMPAPSPEESNAPEESDNPWEVPAAEASDVFSSSMKFPSPPAQAAPTAPAEEAEELTNTNWQIPTMPEHGSPELDLATPPVAPAAPAKPSSTPSVEEEAAAMWGASTEDSTPMVPEPPPKADAGEGSDFVTGSFTEHTTADHDLDDPRRLSAAEDLDALALEEAFLKNAPAGELTSSAGEANSGTTSEPSEIVLLQSQLERLDQDMWKASDDKHSGILSEEDWETKRQKWQNERQELLHQIEALRNARKGNKAA